jgi:predicted CoA-binding protein
LWCLKIRENQIQFVTQIAGWGIQENMKIHLPDGMKSAGDPIAEILRSSKTIAVVGLSGNPRRPSHEVAEYLQRVGYRIIPVNPREKEVLGERAYARLEDVPEKVDIVDIFRRAEEVAGVVESAMGIGAKVVWMQLGVEDGAAAEKARGRGLIVVEDACLLVEDKRRRRSIRV